MHEVLCRRVSAVQLRAARQRPLRVVAQAVHTATTLLQRARPKPSLYHNHNPHPNLNPYLSTQEPQDVANLITLTLTLTLILRRGTR